MNKTIRRLVVVLGAVAVAASGLRAQVLQHETGAVNIEVPVRVFQAGTFVDHLNIGDFELFEDGRPQKIEAFYLVKKRIIERQEPAAFSPDTSRHFYLFFEMTEYDSRVRQALSLFVDEVLLPGDNLTLVTPMRTYRMKSEAFSDAGRARVFEQILGLLRRDILAGGTEYREVVDDLKALALTMTGAVGLTATNTQSPMAGDLFGGGSVFDVNISVEEQLQAYTTLLGRLESIRQVDQAQVTALAESLRGQSGRKEIFLFYQREFIPKLDPMILTAYQSVYNERPDIVQTVTGLFEFFRRETSLDVEAVRRAYSDSGAAVHFLFLTRPAPKVPGVTMEEQSEDIFAPFREMSRATGGYMASTANLEVAMKSAVAAAENYYLLYYTPDGYRTDGRFRRITVKVRAGGVSVSHRLGYIAE